jgi:G6PDH family F420-dependent oxidoreductase
MSEHGSSQGHSGGDAGDVRPVRLGWWLSSEEHDPRELVARAAAAEEAGFSTAMISDHLQPWVRRQGNAGHVWTVIGAIAQATEALEVGTGVTAMVHRMHPITVAHAAATAAVMLDGRFFLGVGSGERLNEQPFGQRWPRAGERRDRMAEAIEVLRALWSGKNVNHRDRYWNVENLRLQTRPASPPPIYVAAGGKRSAELAGEMADGLIGVTPDAKTIEVFRGSGGTGKPCVGQLTLSLAATVDEAVENALEWWPNAMVPSAILTELARPSDFEAVATASASPHGMQDAVLCADGADTIVAAVERYVGAGFDTVYLHQIGPDQDRLLDLAAAELLPHFRVG